MAKQYYIDENGTPIQVSGTVNTAELLPISGNDTTDTKTYIDTGLSGKVGAWTGLGSKKVSGASGSLSWTLSNPISSGTDILFSINFDVSALGGNMPRVTLYLPLGYFALTGAFVDFTLIDDRYYFKIRKTGDSEITIDTISSVITGSATDIYINGWVR